MHIPFPSAEQRPQPALPDYLLSLSADSSSEDFQLSPHSVDLTLNQISDHGLLFVSGIALFYFL